MTTYIFNSIAIDYVNALLSIMISKYVFNITTIGCVGTFIMIVI